MQFHNKKRLLQIAKLLEFPQDILLDLPRITLVGNMQLLVENHKGIVEYTPSLIRIQLHQEGLVIRGNDLVLSNLQHDQLLIEGCIKELHYGD